MLFLNSIGGVFGFLFGQVTSRDAYNGFQITGITMKKYLQVMLTISGGIFNRTVNVQLSNVRSSDESYQVTIKQEISGRDIHHYFQSRVYISGTLPPMKEGDKLEFPKYSQEYNRVTPGTFHVDI
jgi:hypothetical protein